MRIYKEPGKQHVSRKKNKARMLMVSHVCPYPPQAGDRIRVMSILKGLSRKFHVVFLSLYDGDEDPKAIETKIKDRCDCAEVILVPFRKLRFKALILSILLFRPYRERLFYSREFRRRVRDELKTGRFALIYQHFLTTYPKSWKEARGANALSILDQHNIYKNWWRNVMASDGNPLYRFIALLEWLKDGLLEAGNLSGYDLNVCVSKDEMAATAEYGVSPSKIILGPNGIDVSTSTVQNLHRKSSNEVVFTGSMNLRMNVDAVCYFSSKIWPLIKNNLPNARFTVVGRDPPSKVLKLNGVDGITVTDTVPDVHPYLLRANAFVAPFRQGAGTKLKILEAFSLGIAVISTSLGCQGIEVDHGENILIADTPESFAESVVMVLKHSGLRKRLGANGLGLAVAKYDWKKICDDITDAIYNRLGSQ